MKKFIINLVSCVLVLFCFILVLVFCGCNPESPDVRFVHGIAVYNVGGPSYSRIQQDKEGRPIRCETDFAACFLYADGSKVVAGGLRFEQTHNAAENYIRNPNGLDYWARTDKAGTLSNFVTLPSGLCLFTSWCSVWGYKYTDTGMAARGKRTEPAVVARAGYQNLYDSQNYELIPWYGEDSRFSSVLGGHYHSGGNDSFRSIGQSDVSPKRPYASINRSTGETDFLGSCDIVIDEGYVVVSAAWVMQSGEQGQGYSVPVDRLTGLDHSDTSTLAYLSTPYSLSLSVALAEPLDASIVGFSVPAELTVGKAFMSPIMMTVVDLSGDGKRMIVRSDYVLAIDSRDYDADTVPDTVYDRWTESDDPNDPAINIYAPMFYAMDDPNHDLYDPNFIDHNFVIHNRLDPDRFKPLICVPVSEGQRLQIEFTAQTFRALIPFLAENWLTSNPMMDLNGDGIVNFKDVVLFMKEFQ